MRFSLCLLLLFSVVSSLSFIDGDSLPDPSWSTNCEGAYSQCAEVKVYSNWTNEESELISFHLDAFLREATDSLTVWLLQEGPVRETEATAKTIWKEAQVGVVVVYPRGGYKGKPALGCQGSTRSGWPDGSCRGSVVLGEGSKLGLETFSSQQVAHDLEWAIKKLGKGKAHIVVSQGVNSMAVLQFISLNTDRSNIAYVIADGVSPTTFSTFEQLHRDVGYALRTVLQACDREVQCAARLGATEGAAQRLDNVLQSLKEDSLPCGHELKWTKKSSDTYNQVISLLSQLITQTPLVGSSDPQLMSLIPSVLYRLQRCTEADRKALTALRTVVNNNANADKRMDKSTVLQQMNWFINELSDAGSMAAVDVKKLKASPSSPFANVDFLSEYQSIYSSFPKYSKAVSKPAKTTKNKLLLMYADADPVFSLPQLNGLAMQYQSALHASVRVTVVSGSGQLPLQHRRHLSCLLLHVKQYKLNSRWAEPTACISDDGEGHRNEDANAAEASEFVDQGSAFNFIHVTSDVYYGTKDAWDFTAPQSAEPPGGRYTKKGSSILRFLGKLFKGLVILLLVVGVLWLAYKGFLRYCSGGSHSFSYTADFAAVDGDAAFVDTEQNLLGASEATSGSRGWSVGSLWESAKGKLFRKRPDPTDRPEFPAETHDDDDDDFFARIRR